MSESGLAKQFTCHWCQESKEEIPYGPVGEEWCQSCWFEVHDQNQKNLPEGMRFDGDLMGYWSHHSKKDPDYRTEEEKAALAVMADGYQQLKGLGWREIIYCPKDGSTFLAIEAGSTGVFPCSYNGEWPNGHWRAYHSGDVWPSRPCLWKPMPEKPEEATP